MSVVTAHNLARLAEASFERRGDYESLLFEGRWYSSGELFDRAQRIGTALAELGIGPGDRVIVSMANCPEVGITYNAIWRAGAVVTPAMFLLPVPDLRHVIADAQASAVVTTPEFIDKVTEAVEGLDHVRHVISTGEPDGNANRRAR
jgi:long-chain acyl-CoA synthetase